MNQPTAILQCPRCNCNLDKSVFKNVKIMKCPECSGMLIPNRFLTDLLEMVGTKLYAEVEMDTKAEIVPDPGPIAACPACHQKTNHYGYMECRNAMIDMCERCYLLWIDPDELGVISLLFIKSNAKFRELRERAMKEERERTSIVERTFLSRAVNDAMMLHDHGMWGNHDGIDLGWDCL